MNKYLTKKTRLFFFFVQYSTVEKVTQRHFHTVCMFVTPSALRQLLFLLLECPLTGQSTIPKCLSSSDQSCNLGDPLPVQLCAPGHFKEGPGEATANWP